MVFIYKKMDKLRENKFVLSGIFGVISVVLLYINNNYLDKKENVEMLDYIKIFILGVSISFGTVMLLEMGNKNSTVTTNVPVELKETIPQPVVQPSVSQDIHTGNPNF